MSLPSCPFDPPPVSMCPSETEEAASEDHEDDLDDQDDLDEQDEVDEQDNQEEDEEECTCGGEGPAATCWKCVPSTSAASAPPPPSAAAATSTNENASTQTSNDAEFCVDEALVRSKVTTFYYFLLGLEIKLHFQ